MRRLALESLNDDIFHLHTKIWRMSLQPFRGDMITGVKNENGSL